MTMWIELDHGMRGTFCTLLTDEDGFPEPVQTGFSSNRKDAIAEAKDWAKEIGVEYRGPDI